MPKTFKLRPCDGNTKAWLITLLGPDGQERPGTSLSRTGATPGLALDAARTANLVRPGDYVLIAE